MSPSSDDILNQRRLRAAEIALETARRRRFETNETVAALQSEVQAVKSALAAEMAERERDRESARSEIAAARAAQRVAEQGLVSERERRWDLERELGRRDRAASEHDGLMRQLASEQRVRDLEAEVELVLRRAAEFEYGVRMAAFDAFGLLRGLVDRVGSVLEAVRLPLPELGRGDPETGTGAGVAEVDSAAAEPGVAAAHPSGSGLDSDRLDAALERLRASTPPPTDPE